MHSFKGQERTTHNALILQISISYQNELILKLSYPFPQVVASLVAYGAYFTNNLRGHNWNLRENHVCTDELFVKWAKKLFSDDSSPSFQSPTAVKWINHCNMNKYLPKCKFFNKKLFCCCMAQCNTVASPLLIHCRYHSIVLYPLLTHQGFHSLALSPFQMNRWYCYSFVLSPLITTGDTALHHQ